MSSRRADFIIPDEILDFNNMRVDNSTLNTKYFSAYRYDSTIPKSTNISAIKANHDNVIKDIYEPYVVDYLQIEYEILNDFDINGDRIIKFKSYLIYNGNLVTDDSGTIDIYIGSIKEYSYTMSDIPILTFYEALDDIVITIKGYLCNGLYKEKTITIYEYTYNVPLITDINITSNRSDAIYVNGNIVKYKVPNIITANVAKYLNKNQFVNKNNIFHTTSTEFIIVLLNNSLPVSSVTIGDEILIDGIPYIPYTFVLNTTHERSVKNVEISTIRELIEIMTSDQNISINSSLKIFSTETFSSDRSFASTDVYLYTIPANTTKYMYPIYNPLYISTNQENNITTFQNPYINISLVIESVGVFNVTFIEDGIPITVLGVSTYTLDNLSFRNISLSSVNIEATEDYILKVNDSKLLHIKNVNKNITNPLYSINVLNDLSKYAAIDIEYTDKGLYRIGDSINILVTNYLAFDLSIDKTFPLNYDNTVTTKFSKIISTNGSEYDISNDNTLTLLQSYVDTYGRNFELLVQHNVNNMGIDVINNTKIPVYIPEPISYTLIITTRSIDTVIEVTMDSIIYTPTLGVITIQNYTQFSSLIINALANSYDIQVIENVNNTVIFDTSTQLISATTGYKRIDNNSSGDTYSMFTFLDSSVNKLPIIGETVTIPYIFVLLRDLDYRSDNVDLKVNNLILSENTILQKYITIDSDNIYITFSSELISTVGNNLVTISLLSQLSVNTYVDTSYIMFQVV